MCPSSCAIENLFLALDTLRAHKLRSFLTVLGVVMAVAVIMLVAALLAGFDQTVTEAITGYGADTAFISRFDQGPRVGRRPKEERERKPLTLEDGEAIMEQCPAVKQVTVWIVWWEQPHKVRYKDSEVVGIEFRGAFPNFPQVYANATMKQGRFFTQAENLHREKVVVVGEDVSNALFPNLEAGNIAYKLLSRIGGAEAIGPILMGLSKPVHVLQRGAEVNDIVNMAAIAVVEAQQQATGETAVLSPAVLSR